MTIFWRELRAGVKALLLWSMVVGGLLAVCVALYPSMADSMGDVSALFADMGSFSAAFGMDTLAFGSLMGFYGVECGNILGLGGAAHVALGGDWDGCDTIPALPSIDRIGDFYDYLLYHGYHETVVRNLFYNNLMRVVSER